jgi:hypothetical protein
MNFDIYTTGGIEFLSQVYKGVIMTFGDSSYETLLRLFGLFSIIFASIALIGKQQIDYLAKRVAILFLISGFSFGLRADVTIIDTKHNQTYVVSGAPWIPAYVHSLFSSASYQLTNIAQQVFHTGTVNVYEAAATGKNAWGSVNLDYNKTGFGGFFEYLNFFKNYRFNTTGITDLDKIYRKFHIALTECTINEIPLWPDNDFQKKVLLSSNLIQDLRPTVNGYVEFEGQPTDCIALYDSAIEDWNTIKSKFDTAGDPTLNLLAKLGITAMDSQKVQEANAEILQQGTVQLSDMIGQAGMTWALSDAWDSFLADQSPERAMVYKYEVGRNIEESKQMGRSLGLYAKETVPLMKIVFESMTIAFIPVTFLIILVSGGNVIRNSIFSFAWVYAWDPVLATINGIVNIAAIAKVKAALNAAAVYNNALNGDWMGYSIQAMNIMYSTLDYIPSVAGYLAISTPGIAYMLIKGGEMTMASIASMMAAPVMSTPTHVEAASSLETQKIANQTGKSFGQVEMQYNAAGQAKLNAMVFQGGVDRHGYNKIFGAESGAFDHGVATKGGLGDAYNKLGETTIRGATANLEAGRTGSGSVGNMDTHFDMGRKGTEMDFARREGTWQGIDGNTDILRQAEAIKTKFDTDYSSKQLALEMQTYSAAQWAIAKTTMTAERLGAVEGMVDKGRNIFGMQGDDYSVIQQMSNYTARGGVVDSTMAQNINDKMFGGKEVIKAGMRVDAGIADGKIYLTAAAQDGTGSIEIRDGRQIEKGVLRDADVSGYKFSGSYSKETDLTTGKTLGTYTGIVNGKEGHLSVDADGKAVFAEAKGGHDLKNLKVDSTTVDDSTSIKHGTSTVTDNSTTIKQGTTISGTPGVTTYEKDAALMSALKGDMSLAKKLTTGDTASQTLNQIEYGKALVSDLSDILDRKGIKFYEVEAHGNFNLKAFGLSVGTSAKTGSKDQTNFNVLYGAYQRGLSNVIAEARQKGISEASAVSQFNKDFTSTILNDAVNTKPILSPDKYAHQNKTTTPQSGKRKVIEGD